MGTIELSGKTLGIGIIVVLVALTGFLAYKLYFPKTGYTTSTYDGLSSYEEMMQAHHGGSAGSMGGSCGGVAVKSGAMSEYGISYDQSGYEKLLNYNTLRLTQEQANSIIGLDVSIDCCSFSKIQASGNCECEHHLALYGLAKLLTTKGYDRQYIQSEIDKWKDVFSMSNIGGCG